MTKKYYIKHYRGRLMLKKIECSGLFNMIWKLLTVEASASDKITMSIDSKDKA